MFFLFASAVTMMALSIITSFFCPCVMTGCFSTLLVYPQRVPAPMRSMLRLAETECQAAVPAAAVQGAEGRAGREGGA